MNINETEHQETEELIANSELYQEKLRFSSESTYDPIELNLRTLFFHSGSGVGGNKLGRYQKFIFVILMYLQTMNAPLFYGLQSILINEPNRFLCGDNKKPCASFAPDISVQSVKSYDMCENRDDNKYLRSRFIEKIDDEPKGNCTVDQASYYQKYDSSVISKFKLLTVDRYFFNNWF